ncbi:hypothetical protein BOX15_Mlig000199g2 [Macrostomum lignano]|uniref:G patch domain-containing protein n=1 Tax=Macrostomum lignano TaxID=282301 RepID=A0A267F9Z7_9PLAT|nr:hypothetical protein BOX15_Mlig000199g2 [Macrostomum lignano]
MSRRSGRLYYEDRHRDSYQGDDNKDDDEEDDDDSDEFLGTPLELLDDSDDDPATAAAKQAKRRRQQPQSGLPIHQQRALDERGRPVRFHGAFTGGFSAGHFNSVGTVEGFKPGEFRSSRRDRQGDQRGQRERRPEDFMDAEDLGDFGIAPREVRARPEYDGIEMRRLAAAATVGGRGGAGADPLAELLLPSETGLGDRLLRHLGWRRRRQPRPTTGNENPDSDDGDGAGDAGDAAAVDLLSKLRLKPGRDTRGLGYSGLDAGRALSSTTASSTSVGGMRGQAFGVGALESEDADVFGSDSMANYDFSIGTEAEEAALASRRRNFGWTAPDAKRASLNDVDDDDDDNDDEDRPLKGFVQRRGGTVRRKAYPPPELPAGFVPMHRPAPAPDALDVALRQMRAEAEEAAEAEADLPKPPTPPTSSKTIIPPRNSRWDVGAPLDKSNSTSVASSTAAVVAPAAPAATSAPLTTARWHQQFGDDPAKQARYHSYLRWRTAAGAEHAEAYAKAADGAEGLTDWERNLERDQFARAADTTAAADRSAPTSLSSRFLPAGASDQQYGADDSLAGKAADEAAADAGGDKPPTRRLSEWRPHAMVCRRLNVPNPYPEEAPAKRDSSGRPSQMSAAVGQAPIASAQSLFACLFEDNANAPAAAPPAPNPIANVQQPAPAAVPASDAPASTQSQTSLALSVATATAPASVVEASRPSMDLFRSVFGSDDENDGDGPDSGDKEGDADAADRHDGGSEERPQLAKAQASKDTAAAPAAATEQSTSRMLAAGSLFAHLFEDQPPSEPFRTPAPPPPPPPPLQPPKPQQQQPPPPSKPVAAQSSSASTDGDRELRRLEKKLRKELKKAKKIKKKRKHKQSGSESDSDSYEFMPVSKKADK